MSLDVEIKGPLLGQCQVCAIALADILEWFGIEEANQKYAEETEELPTFVAEINGDPVGFMALKIQSPESAELYVLGVMKAYHRSGTGKLLLAASEDDLRSQAVRFLQVKTLADLSDDENYAQTRRFYEGQSYVTSEVFPELWHPSNAALQMIKHL